MSAHRALLGTAPRRSLLSTNACRVAKGRSLPQGVLSPPAAPIRLRQREFLPGSNHPSIPLELRPATPTMPLLVDVGPKGGAMSLQDSVALVKGWLADYLSDFGAILFRGLPLRGVHDLQELMLGVDPNVADKYIGGAATRGKLTKSVMEASSDPPEITIEPHNEMSYLHDKCYLIAFYCHVAADVGGETPISDSARQFDILPPQVRDRFLAKGIRYTRHHPDQLRTPGGYLSWQKTFDTQEREEVERFLGENAITDLEWLPDGSVRYEYVRPAAIPHPTTGRMLWFNQAHTLHNSACTGHDVFKVGGFVPYHSTFGDGEEIDLETLALLRAVAWECAVAVTWHHNDLLILDNQRMQHGRMSYTGTRKMFTTFCIRP